MAESFFRGKFLKNSLRLRGIAGLTISNLNRVGYAFMPTIDYHQCYIENGGHKGSTTPEVLI